jgi:two-component system sensor histidine kinase DesK
MFFQPMGSWDILVALLATAIFLPLHYWGFNAEPRERIITIAALMALATATAPFVNGNSVFFVYAAASAGFLRPIRLSTVVLVLCAIVYLAGATLFERHPLEMSMAMLIGLIVWVSCFSASEGIYENERAERARSLDLQQASLIERERIARDLHDLLGHTLTLVSLKADLVRRLMSTDPERAREELDSLQASSRDALADVREALSGLVRTSVRTELANATAALDAAGVTLTIEGVCPELSAEQDTAFGLMLREAVTNIIRHSNADQATITFAREDDVYSLEVTDNGEAGHPGAVKEGNGLAGLRRRLEQIGGMLSVQTAPGQAPGQASAPGTGVRLRALLPV